MNSFSSTSVSASLHDDSCQLQKLLTEPGMEQEENEDVSLEWLSIFVEDCFSGNPTLSNPQNPTISPNLPPQSLLLKPNKPFVGMKQLSSTKNRAKRRKLAFLDEENILLLPQPYWLADSQLILPKRDFYENDKAKTIEEEEEDEEKGAQEQLGKERRQVHQPRRCSHCLSQKTPQWRAGPLGPRTLCNACGVRFKSGGLLPEYRPVKSPTFVSCKHSNSHKKVMEMRMLMHANQFGIKD